MIGLLKKDFFILWHAYHKNLALVLVLYSCMALAMNFTFMIFFLSWIMGFYILGGLSIDNYSKWDLYAASLPVSKRQIVGAKFILIALALLFSFLVGILLCGLLTLLRGEPFWENLFSSFVLCFVCLGYFGISLTLSYRFGVEKARTTVLLAVAVIVGIGVTAIQLDLIPQSALSPGFQSLFLGNLALVGWGLVLPLACVALYLVCWLISTYIYARKEF